MSLEKRHKTFAEKILFPKKSVNSANLQDQVAGKVILITGASYGIGECLALQLGNAKGHLILVGRTAEKLEAVKNQIIEAGGKATVFAVDLRNDEEIQALIEKLKSLGGVDLFVNNAGKSIRRPISESLDRYHDFSRTMAINYEAPVKLMLALTPQLKEKRGHVINVSAINVLMAPAPFWAAYQASKTAFDQWYRSARPELEYMGIKVTTIYLPLVRTRMIAPTKAYDKVPAMTPEHVATIISKYIVSQKRVFKPWWSWFGIVGSVLFRRTWERSTRKQVKKQQVSEKA